MMIVPEDIEAYAASHTSELDPVLGALETETRESMKYPHMLVGKVEGRFLQLLVRLTGARRILEIGTFTGYSALCMAEALPDDGSIVTCDIDEAATSLARQYWAKSPHGRKIDLRLAPALDTLASLDGPFDMVFIDADKENYTNYWEAALPKVRQGGLLVVDNVLWGGRVLNPVRPVDIAVDAFNKLAAEDPRVDSVLLTVRDGVTLARKR
ncbi:MAG: class I SAM-dependent methyltransferase [Candidatus Hydrogenedentes bacterium]|nr:class I SAM-dependent methyltransferase [Candidatus Hydrogenedentota bacterium]